MSNVMRSEMKGEGGDTVSLWGHLTGVTLMADWLIPCPLSHLMMLRGRISPKVIVATHGGTCSMQHNCTHTHLQTK